MCDSGSHPIGDYALIGNLRTAALVSRRGEIDWFCPGRFDNPACLAALLGRAEHGRWQLAPAAAEFRVERRYLPQTLLLQTTFRTAQGRVELLDYMPLEDNSHIVRELRCVEGEVAMRMACQLGFGYGRYSADLSLENECLVFRSRKDTGSLPQDSRERVRIASNIPLAAGTSGIALMEFTLEAGRACYFVLSHAGNGEAFPALPDMSQSAEDSAQRWRRWLSQCTYDGPWKEAVTRSLIVLKAMTYSPSGAILAAPTTSLPETSRGSANWDYRFTWLRDASLVLDVLLSCGFQREAQEWSDWLIGAVASSGGNTKTLYTIDGFVSRNEQTLDWLPGYADAKPVRIGNMASQQFQLDLSGEVVQLLYLARKLGLKVQPNIWELQCHLLENIAGKWREPDAGIWEARGQPQHYVHSKVLAWVAYDRSIKDAEAYKLDAPLEEWQRQRDEIYKDLYRHGLHPDGYFVRFYGSDETDPSLLMLPLVGFVAADDPHMINTLHQIEQQNLSADGFVYRNPTGSHTDREGCFILCNYWLVDNYMLAGRHQEARALFEKLLQIRNDVGLLAEEYDSQNGTFLGNFPQSFSHLGLINSARLLGSMN